MTTPLSVLVLVAKQTADEIFATVLEVADAAGLPVSTWRVGDPTRTQFRALARKLASADEVRQEYAKASFITGPEGQRAEGDWLSLRAADVYGKEREESTFATPTITLNNAGGGLYVLQPGALKLLASSRGATFTNQAAITINPLETGVEALLTAEVGGSAGTVGVDEIDTIVSPPLTGVTIAGSTAAAGVDEQSDSGLVEQCLATLGALSPNGPADAYEYVARNFELTGVLGVTRAYSAGDSTDGTVTVYVGTATAGLGSEDVASIQAAVDEWSQPLCTDATVASMTPVEQTIQLAITPPAPEAQAAIEATIDAYFAAWDYSRQGGIVARDALAALARAAIEDLTGEPPHAVAVTVPATDPEFTEAQFPTRGTVMLA